MGEFIDFIFGNLFLIIIIISGIIGFFSNNKEEEKKKRQSQRPVERQERRTPTRQARRDELSNPKRQARQEPPSRQTPPVEETILEMDSSSESIEEEQQAQMERLQRRFGGAQASKTPDKAVVDALTEDGLDLDFIKNQQLRQLENVAKELSAEQKVLRKDLKSSLKNKGLINGIIMAEVLGKPRALKPYRSVTSERYNK